MNAAILLKTLRDNRLLLLVLPLAALAFEAFFVRALMEFTADKAIFAWLERGFARNLVKILVGADLLGDVSMTTLMSVGFAHPFLYAVSWTLVIAMCSRVIAGEIDRGTADLLLAMPVSRSNIYVSLTCAGLAALLPLSLAPLAGAWLGQTMFDPPQPIELRRLAPLVINLAMLHLAVGGVALLASSVCSRRGPAVAIALAVLLSSLLLSFLAQFSETFRHASFLSLLEYYKPLPIVRSGSLAVRDLTVLSGIALCSWLAGLLWFTRRDLCAA